MSDQGAAACTNCRRPQQPARLDQHSWCPECREVVIRRATVIAHVVAAAVALSLAIWVLVGPGPESRFLMAWAVLVAAVHFVLYRVVRRVAFAMIRGRGVRPPETDHVPHP